ncbi:unnamed protein product [Brachionus calyciflorus]|uniref:MABP domain-containing protein n=1 Tax=Brachionus calyciflorus TaxID=104777 RepID=A0A814HIW2_9BILA|nr:unnamed protein product [Brachionus calyciflorus]
MNSDLPITALCVVAERSRCPANYTPIDRSYDTNSETDLWKDGLFGKKTNRFICFTKDYPIKDTFNVIEDIKLLNERETLPGFITIDKCNDTSEKAFQKKVLCIKVSQRFFTQTAVSDIIILLKSKRPPFGYSYIGEINGQSICIRFSQIPKNSPTSNQGLRQLIPPPIPPRPNSSQSNFQDGIVEKDFVYVATPGIQPEINRTNNFDYPQNTIRSYNSVNSSTNSNPLNGIPFQINPIYDSLRINNNSNEFINAERIDRKMASFNQTLEKIECFNFNLERACLESG